MEQPEKCPACGGSAVEWDDGPDTYDMFVEGRDFHLFCENEECDWFKKDIYSLCYGEPKLIEVVDLVEAKRKELEEIEKAKREKTCCVREECNWMDGKGENDHGCIGFVQGAIFAQIEDLPKEQKSMVLKSAFRILWNLPDKDDECTLCGMPLDGHDYDNPNMCQGKN
jgi:hypothetical protein